MQVTAIPGFLAPAPVPARVAPVGAFKQRFVADRLALGLQQDRPTIQNDMPLGGPQPGRRSFPVAEPGRKSSFEANPVESAWPARAPSPITEPAGQGRVVTQPGAPIASNAGQVAGDGFTGRIASQSIAALKRAGGVSAAYLSRANGNREVDVLATPGFDPNRPYEVLVYARGIEGDNAKSLDGQFLAEGLRDLNAQGRNVLLILPKSPSDMHSWFAGKEDLGALVPEALAQFRSLTGIPVGRPQELWLMAHSGGGKAVQNAMEKSGAPHYDKILLADSTYGTWAAGTIAALHAQQPGVQIATVVTPHNKDRAVAQLASQGLRVDNMPAFVHPDHNGVPSYMLAKFLPACPTLTFSTVR